MKPAAILVVFLVLGACGEASRRSSTTLSPEPTTTGQPGRVMTAASTTISTGDGARVVITASAMEQPDGSIELCPPGMTGVCPGIMLIGAIEPGLISSQGDPNVIQVTGIYDGRELTAASEPVAVAYPPITNPFHATLCPDLEGTHSVDPNSPQLEAVDEYARSHPDIAASWWDPESSLLTVWFKGDDVSEQQAAIAELAGGEPVCVVGGARFSLADLMEAAELLVGFTDSRGLPIATLGFAFGTVSSSVLGGPSNRVSLPLEKLDADTREALADRTGDRVAPHPYIEMLDGLLSELPVPIPVVEGDVEILTNRVRESGGMAALALAELHFDPALNCVYISGRDEDEGGRTVPVWPFGYTATRSPMTVYDYDGVQVASDGDPIDLGGGGIGLDFIEGNTCGADGAFIVSR